MHEIGSTIECLQAVIYMQMSEFTKALKTVCVMQRRFSDNLIIRHNIKFIVNCILKGK